MKTEQTTIVYAQWDRWTSYDVTKHHMITTDVTLKNSSKDKEESALFRIGLSREISRISIIFSLKPLLSLVKMENLQRMDSSYNIKGVLGSPLVCCCQSLPFFL